MRAFRRRGRQGLAGGPLSRARARAARCARAPQQVARERGARGGARAHRRGACGCGNTMVRHAARLQCEERAEAAQRGRLELVTARQRLRRGQAARGRRTHRWQARVHVRWYVQVHVCACVRRWAHCRGCCLQQPPLPPAAPPTVARCAARRRACGAAHTRPLGRGRSAEPHRHALWSARGPMGCKRRPSGSRAAHLEVL